MKKVLKILFGCAISIVVLLFIGLVVFTWKRVDVCSFCMCYHFVVGFVCGSPFSRA